MADMDDGAGKGSEPRPVDKAKFDANYDRIFGSESEVAARRRAFIEQQQKAKEQADCPVRYVEPILLGEDTDAFLEEQRRVEREINEGMAQWFAKYGSKKP